MSSPVYSEFSFVPASAYAANMNILPDIRTAVQNGFLGLDWRGSEADILGVEMQSAAAFTVKLNRETQLTAVQEGTVYTVRYNGPIEYIVFNAAATLTYLHVRWGMANKTHGVVAISTVSGAKISRGGYEIPQTKAGEYELAIGGYIITANGVRAGFFYNLEESMTVKLSLENADVVVGDALTYTGSEQTKEVKSVTLGGNALTEDTNYAVADNTGTNAGAYSLRIDGKGDYKGTIIVPWTIAKAAAGLSVSPEALEMSAGTSDTFKITTSSNGEMRVENSAPEVAALGDVDESSNVTVEAQTADETVITVTQDENENYLAGQAQCTVTVTA